MLALTDPHEAYRRSAFDARVQGGDSAALVQLCLEQAIAGLGSALFAQERGDASLRSKALTRTLTAITALEMGVDRNAPLAQALLQVYGAARKAVLDSVTDFNADLLQSVRQDFLDIESALRPAG
ncbi:flagellar protein FliS [Pelagerythrobacter marinus]|jgi:flagellar protein FliS|uniref:Flagellin n=1 Tax=Pelagerythrobacter marinus TaxID=538382 RepID=A0ABW9UY08_9SPHN|nr:flagellar protein FliS [Pelagerythrobacter marinus]MEC9067927.1 flagellar protein FliS [Pseudomonadota bacterium]MXO69709.1 flagellin [Pelagerythrobacter marinus]USA39736.1 flagellar protein FliS [Pelagerythrobacter marinus]WPZ06133.1 flagellar protein FliS [Pelagerythrobacter marinus]